MIPKVILKTTDNPIFISPEISAHKPKPMEAGNRFGIKLIRPNRNDLSAKISSEDMNTRAKTEPLSILFMLVSPICANIKAGLAALRFKSVSNYIK